MTAQTPIYLLDDDPFVLELLAEGFNTLGHVFPSASWAELNATITAHPPTRALFVCDVSMPDADGLELCRLLHRFFPDAAILVFTASDPRAREARTLPGVRRVVLKDQGLPTLLATARELLQDL